MEFPGRNVPTDVIVTIDEKSDDTKSQKESVTLYATRVFQGSTIGMVASIVSSHSRVKKCFKSLLLVLCISGFLYQCTTFIQHVLEYPTVLNVDMEIGEYIAIPAFTFCSNNAIKRSVFCDLYPDRCYEPSEKFCSNFSSYCGAGKTLIPKKEYYKVEDTMSYEEILKYGNNLDELVWKNGTRPYEEISGPFLRLRDKNYFDATNCYSMNSVAYNNKIPYKAWKDPDTYSNRLISRIVFYVEEEEMFIPGIEPGVFFSIHSPYIAVNPFFKGFFLKPGRTYRIHVDIIQEHYLEAPFATKCINYEEIWEANNRTGPRAQKMCQNKCNLQRYLDCFTCVHPGVLYPHTEKICKKEDLRYRKRCNYLKHFNCFNKCRQDCNVTKYMTEVMERHGVYYESEDDVTDPRRYITVEILLDGGEFMSLKHSPKYMNVEVFSAIGGFIGCWLGISLMDIIDVFLSVFVVCGYAWRKWRTK